MPSPGEVSCTEPPDEGPQGETEGHLGQAGQRMEPAAAESGIEMSRWSGGLKMLRRGSQGLKNC